MDAVANGGHGTGFEPVFESRSPLCHIFQVIIAESTSRNPTRRKHAHRGAASTAAVSHFAISHFRNRRPNNQRTLQAGEMCSRSLPPSLTLVMGVLVALDSVVGGDRA